MNVDQADALPPGMLCFACDKAIFHGQVLRDDQRHWLVVHRECGADFVPDQLKLVYGDAMQALLDVDRLPEEQWSVLQRIVAVQAAHADLMRELVERSAGIEFILNSAREKWAARPADGG